MDGQSSQQIGTARGPSASPLEYEPVREESYGVRSARGGMIMVATTLASACISFLTSIGLAWFLLPAHFGVIAVVASIAGIVAVLRDAGAPLILIQRQQEFDQIAGSVFAITVATATICAIITAAAAPFIASARGIPVLLPLLLLTAARFPIGTLGTLSQARLTIDLRWGSVAIANLVHTITTCVLGIYMAWRGWGVYSLVVPPMIADLLRGATVWTLARPAVSLRPHWKIVAPIVISSVFIVLSNLTLAVRSFSDYLALSFLRGENETGLYYYAFVVSQAAARLGLASLPFVVAPVFAKVKDDPERHAAVVTNATHMYAVIGVLPLVLQGVLAWPLFRLFLNHRWEPAAPLFAILTLAILACFTCTMFMQGVWANGFYREYFRFSFGMMFVMVVAFVVGAYLGGATGVAWASVVVQILEFTFFSRYSLKLLKVPYRPTIAPLWRPLVAAMPAVATAWLLHWLLPVSTRADILRIIIVCSVGAVGYCAVLLLLWPSVIKQAWGHAVMALRPAKRWAVSAS